MGTEYQIDEDDLIVVCFAAARYSRKREVLDAVSRITGIMKYLSFDEGDRVNIIIRPDNYPTPKVVREMIDADLG